MLSFLVLCACQPITTDVGVRLLLPQDDTPLAGTDNVTVTLAPDGFTDTFANVGPNFELEVELDPDNTARDLAVYMARGGTLLGYGRTPPFALTGASSARLTVFIALPQTLATLPIVFDLPDANLRAAPIRGFGLVTLASDGSTVFFDAFTLQLAAADPLRVEPALPEGGTLVGDRAFGAVRVTLQGGVRAVRYDLPTNLWSELELDGPVADDRSGAALSFAENVDRLYVFGGLDRLDVLSLDLTPETGQPTARIVPNWQLDAPRPGATAHLLAPAADVPFPLLAGGSDPTLPVIYDVVHSVAAGPTEAWENLHCVALDEATTLPLRALCAGGQRAGAPTADALLVTLDAQGGLGVEEHSDFFPVALRDVLWLGDDSAVYAQAEARWFRAERGNLALTEPPATPLRVTGGQAVPFETGVTVILGGSDSEQAPVNLWQVFSPAVVR